MRSDKTDETVAELLERARPTYGDASRDRALSAMERSREARTGRAVGRRMSWVLRGAAAGVVVLLGLGLLVIPGRNGKRDAQAILAGVAHAMESADSVLCEFSQTEAGRALAEEFVAGLPLPENAVELEYVGPQAVYTGRTRADGTITWAEGMDLGARQWWHYRRDIGPSEGTLWVADLASVESEVVDYLSLPVDERFAGGLPWALAGYLKDEKVEVTSKSYGNIGEVTVVTFSGWGTAIPPDGAPSRFFARNVLEVEKKSGRLRNAYYHCRFGDGPEQLVALFTAEYDVPVPAYLAARPDADKVVKATVWVEDRLRDGREVTFLTMREGGGREVIARTALKDRGDRPAPETASVFKAGEGRAELDEVMANVKNVGLAIQMYLSDHDGVFPPVDNVRDLMPVLDRYLRSRQVFMRPGTEDEVVVEYLVPAGLDARELDDTGGTPVAVADYHPDFAVVAYADGHASVTDKTGPSYSGKWWEDWWREFERKR